MKLVAEQITCIRGGRTIFTDLSFFVQRGEALIIKGENGIGKSTLLKVLAKLIPYQTGNLQLSNIKGMNIKDTDEHLDTYQQYVHYLGHLDAMKAHLTVMENLQFWRDFTKPAGIDQRPLDIHDILQSVGIQTVAHAPAKYLSAGQKRRFSLARLLISPRPIWLLDEPLASLDKEGGKLLHGLMQAHLNDGGMIIATSHQSMSLTPTKTLQFSRAKEEDENFTSTGAAI